MMVIFTLLACIFRIINLAVVSHIGRKMYGGVKV
jgi:hypothetical protein